MKKALLAGIFGLAIFTSARASTTEEIYLDNVDPTPFRLQTYTSATSDVIAVFFTPSLCGAARFLTIPTSVPSEKNRFWHTVLAAKLAKKKMFISYNLTRDDAMVAVSCVVTSYAVKEE